MLLPGLIEALRRLFVPTLQSPQEQGRWFSEL